MSSAASLVPALGSAGSGPPLSADAIADAVVLALGSSLPAILASLPGNASSPAVSVAPASSPASPMVTSAAVHCLWGFGSIVRYVHVAFVCADFYAVDRHNRLKRGPRGSHYGDRRMYVIWLHSAGRG